MTESKFVVKLRREFMPEIDNAKLKEIYTTMVRIRSFEERAITKYRKGLSGFVHPSIG